MISIVVVSHSRALARAAVALAHEMVPEAVRPRIVVASGLDDETTGTDAVAVAAAIDEVDSPDGTLVLVDLGSALLSTEMALEFVEPDVAERVRISSAPMVEGLVAAAVCASSGAGLDQVDAEAGQSLLPKRQHLGHPSSGQQPTIRSTPAPAATAIAPGDELELRVVVQNQHGLHARPCASIVAAMAGFDATVTISRADDPDELGTVDARSIMAVQGLGLRRGEELVARFSGPQAHHAHRDFAELAARNFGDGVPAHQPQAVAQTLGGSPIVELPLCVDVSTYGPGDPQEEAARLERAMAAADGFVEGLAARVPDGSATGAVLRAIRSILADPMLGQGFREEVQDGASAVAAVRTTMAEACRFFETMTNPYLRERGTDLRALERLVLRALVDEGDLTIADVPAGHLVLVEELDAITATQLDPRQVPGVLTRTSGSNGHGLIVARDRGLAVHVVDAG